MEIHKITKLLEISPSKDTSIITSSQIQFTIELRIVKKILEESKTQLKETIQKN
jgi:hypothetical protein